MAAQSPGAEKHLRGGLFSLRISHGHFFLMVCLGKRGYLKSSPERPPVIFSQ